MAVDALTVVGAATIATLHEFHVRHARTILGMRSLTAIHGRSAWIVLALMCGFVLSLILTSQRLRLYWPTRLDGFLHEQRLSVQACLTSGLLLTGALYLIRVEDIPRNIVLGTLWLVMLTLSLRRLLFRSLMYRQFERGESSRNVFIVGTGPEAHALRHQLENNRHLGYAFKGFIAIPISSERFVKSGDVVGTLDTLFQNVRRQFVDEVFFTTPCDRGVVMKVLERARQYKVDVRVLPDMYDGLAWESPIEYIGQFPTIPLHSGHVPELELIFKRILDVIFSFVMLVLLAPTFLVIAVAIKIDSRGPVFYLSERIGKKGRVFRCIKFRTMVPDAEKRRSDVVHMNERDDILFKISDDPRITKIGKFLRKYSLDELPQFFNVLSGDMSIVGPRPSIASEVRQYKLDQLRRLDVTPGITGLWQVQGRRDPSFENYISLDVKYIENWSVWLDVKIIWRTVSVVLSGTGT
jgi:exopolysaccharide biosynthesis polyprenyl glycosylphosphotransferase